MGTTVSKFIAISLCFILSQPMAYAGPIDGVVRLEQVALRAAPDGAPGKVYPQGSPVVVMKQDRKNPGWYIVTVNGEVGYMHKNDLTTPAKYRRAGLTPLTEAIAIGGSSTVETNTPVPEVVVQNPVVDNSVPVVAETPTATVTIDGGSEVPGSYTPDKAGGNLLAAPEKMYISATNLNMRSLDSRVGEIYGVFAQETEVTVLGSNATGDWVYVEVGSDKGWMKKSYLSTTNPNPDIEVAPRPPLDIPGEQPAVADTTVASDIVGDVAVSDAPSNEGVMFIPPADIPIVQPVVQKPEPGPAPEVPESLQVPAGSCISEFSNIESHKMTVELKRLLQNRNVENSAWHTEDGKLGFNISEDPGGILITVNKLPEEAIHQIENEVGFFKRWFVRGAINDGKFAFNATICKNQEGNFEVSLVGTKDATGNNGNLVIKPTGTGFEMEGILGKNNLEKASYVAQ